MPRAFMARAEYYRLTGATAKAQLDLDEAYSLAMRSGIHLHEADCHLGYARLYLAMRPSTPPQRGSTQDAQSLDEARRHLSAARALIDQCGYHRRDGEVRELEAALA